jgi:tRNA A37 N6-isopentenylltransferase MiaA
MTSKQETESATRKLINHIERDLEAASAAAARRVAERRAQAIALRDRLSVLNTDYKSSLRALCEDYNALKRARDEDVQQSVAALAEIERLRSSDADALLRRVDAKRRRVAIECQSAHKSVHSNDGVKSMLLELARSM